MAEIVIKFVQLFCNVPGHSVIGPVLLPILPNPINIVVYLAFLFGFYFGPKNSFVNGTAEGGSRSWNKAAGYAFLFYYISMAVVYAILVSTTCQIATIF